jgi:excisionase family DNA binding protein
MNSAALVVVSPENLEALIERAVERKVRAVLRDVMPAGQGQHVTVAEAAARLGVCEKTVYRRIKSGELPHVQLGRALRVNVQHLAVDEEDVAKLARVARAA